MELRPYQKEGIQAIFEEWRRGQRSVLYQMPTGTGKTVLFNEIVRMGMKGGRRIVIIAHRKELIEQIERLLLRIGVNAGIIMAGIEPDHSKKVQIASIQTLARREPPKANLVIIDECHHAKAKSYLKLWDDFPDAKFLGVTATPIRLSGEGFDDLFDVLIPSMTTKQFIENGTLVNVRQFVGCTPDLAEVKISKGDYVTKMLSGLMLDNSIMASITETYQKHAFGKSTIVFAVNIEHSKALVEKFREIGVSAEHIDAKTPKAERTEILERFKKGEIQVICNVEIITEGFDFPECEVVILARPTRSLALYLQMVGRVMRNADGKEAGIILDNAGLWLEHGLATKDRVWKLKGKSRRGRKHYYMDDDVAVLDNEGVIQEMDSYTPQELEGLELIELTDELFRLFIFEDYLSNVQREQHKLSSAMYRYRERLEQGDGVIMSAAEFEYIKRRMDGLNDKVSTERRYKPGFWYFQEKELDDLRSGRKKIEPKAERATEHLGARKWTSSGASYEGSKESYIEDDEDEYESVPEFFEEEYEREYEIFYSNQEFGDFPDPTVIVATSQDEAVDRFHEAFPGCFVERIEEI